MKKQLKLILIIAAATVVLVLSWWGISLIPNDNTSVSSGVVQTVDLYTVEQENIVSIEVKNELDEFVITNSENSFTVNGLEDYPIYSSRITSIVSAISDVTAKRMVEENPQDLVKYGLETPKTVATMTDKDNRTYTLTIGDEAPSGGYYFLYNDTSTVYTISAVSAEALKYDRKSLVDIILAPTTEELGGELSFETIELSGTVREQPIKIVNVDTGDDDTVVLFTYQIVSPGRANLDSTNGSTFLNGLISAYAEKAEVLSPSEEDLEEYGFNNPYSTLTMVANGDEYQIIVGKVEGDYAYAIRPDRDIIYKVPTYTIEWLETQYDDLVDKLFLTPYIGNVETVQISFPDVTYDYQTYYTDETDLTVTYKGKALDPAAFKCLYQVLVNAYFENYTMEEPTGSSVMSITYHYNDGHMDTVDFFESKENPRQVLIVLNGENTRFSMRYNFVEKVKGDCVNAIDGKEIITDW